MQYVLYFIIAIGATTVGSLTGMGGGVIIKPLLDLLKGYDVATIGVLSSITVFSMSVVSIGKQILAKTKIPFATAVPLALGSVMGGILGENFSILSWMPYRQTRWSLLCKIYSSLC